MQVGFFSMGSAALPKKPGHPSPARIPYVRVLVQNKKAARAQQGLSVYYQKPRHLASFPSLNSPIGRNSRHKCRERKKHKNRTPHLYQQKAPSTNATEVRSTKALLLISILPKLSAQMPQKEEPKKPRRLSLTSLSTDWRPAQRRPASWRPQFPRLLSFPTLRRAGF